MATKKTCNNKVEFTACGKSLVFRLSDKELRNLRVASIRHKGDDWEHFNCGHMYNFSAYAFFEYDTTRTKYGRFAANFPYHDFEKIYWTIID